MYEIRLSFVDPLTSQEEVTLIKLLSKFFSSLGVKIPLEHAELFRVFDMNDLEGSKDD